MAELDQEWIDSLQEFPDGGKVYIDPRQIVIPPMSGTTEYGNQPDLPDYIVNGGLCCQEYNTINGGSSTDEFSTFDGGGAVG